jgi:hypothetical protein
MQIALSRFKDFLKEKYPVYESNIRAEREQELKESMLGYRLRKDRNVNFLDYFQACIDNYTKKDLHMIQIALSRFKDFLKEKYPVYTSNIRAEHLNKDMMAPFVEYLQSRSVGEGAKRIETYRKIYPRCG